MCSRKQNSILVLQPLIVWATLNRVLAASLRKVSAFAPCRVIEAGC